MDPEAHILVVDDDAQVRQLIGRFLRENGYRVTGARDGREMRETLALAIVNVVILDLMQISRIRRKLKGGEQPPPLIKAVRGAGYIFLPTAGRC